MSDKGKTKEFAEAHEEYVNSYPWESVGSISSVQATLTGAGLSIAAVAALAATKTAIFRPKFGSVAEEIRFYTEDASANETAIIEVYAAHGDDVYTLIGQLTLTVGTAQNGAADKLFVDGIVESGVVWLTDTKAVHVNNNTIARWAINVHGYDRFLFIATGGTMALDATDTLHIEARRF